VNWFASIPTTASFTGILVLSRYYSNAWNGWTFPNHVSESV
jgi:hypothetical protein